MSARLRTSVKRHEYIDKKARKKRVLENSFDVSGPQTITSARAPLDSMTQAKRKRASSLCIVFGLAIAGIYILVSKGIPLMLILLGLKMEDSQMVSTGLQSIQFDNVDKEIVAAVLSLFALISLILRFPEIREVMTELLRILAPRIRR